MPSILAVGDLMVGDSAASPGYGFASRYGQTGLASALAPVADFLRTGDLVIGNLEVVLSRRGVRDDQYATRDMRGWPRFASELRTAGFTVLNLANNHALQHGLEAFHETRELLEATGILCCGLRGAAPWTCEPVRVTLPDATRVGLLGYCLRPRQYYRDLTPPYAEGTGDTILADIKRLRPECDLMVVSLHWGSDYVSLPSAAEMTLAHAIVGSGATLLLGHHPHVMRALERRGNAVIAYSLGNFVGDQTWHPELGVAGIMCCTTDRSTVSGCTFRPTRLRQDYSVAFDGATVSVPETPPAALAEEPYRRDAESRVKEFRRAKHIHAIRNLWRSDLRLMAQLATRTVANRLKGLLGRAG